MQILASKFIYPKDVKNLKDIFLPFQKLSLQLAFFQRKDFLKLDHSEIKDIYESLNIKVLTIHAPTTDVFDEEFLEIVESIKKIYKVKVISIHPQRGDTNSALAKLEEYEDFFRSLDIILAYENFPSPVSKRKWIYLPQDMYSKFNLPFLKLTFDTSHLDSPSECVKELNSVYDKVEVIHLSDRDSKKQHLPLGEGILPYKQFLNFLKEKDFKGFVVLEYLEEFKARLIEDLKRVSRLLL